MSGPPLRSGPTSDVGFQELTAQLSVPRRARGAGGMARCEDACPRPEGGARRIDGRSISDARVGYRNVLIHDGGLPRSTHGRRCGAPAERSDRGFPPPSAPPPDLGRGRLSGPARPGGWSSPPCARAAPKRAVSRPVSVGAPISASASVPVSKPAGSKTSGSSGSGSTVFRRHLVRRRRGVERRQLVGDARRHESPGRRRRATPRPPGRGSGPSPSRRPPRPPPGQLARHGGPPRPSTACCPPCAGASSAGRAGLCVFPHLGPQRRRQALAPPLRSPC